MNLADILTIGFGLFVPAIATVMVWRGASPGTAGRSSTSEARPGEPDARSGPGRPPTGGYGENVDQPSTGSLFLPTSGDIPDFIPYRSAAALLAESQADVMVAMKELQAEVARLRSNKMLVTDMPNLTTIPRLVDPSLLGLSEGQLLKFPDDMAETSDTAHLTALYLLAIAEDAGDEVGSPQQEEKLF